MLHRLEQALAFMTGSKFSQKIIYIYISEDATIGGKKKNNDKPDATYETIDAQTKKSCNRGTALGRSVEKNFWGRCLILKS